MITHNYHIVSSVLLTSASKELVHSESQWKSRRCRNSIVIALCYQSDSNIRRTVSARKESKRAYGDWIAERRSNYGTSQRCKRIRIALGGVVRLCPGREGR